MNMNKKVKTAIVIFLIFGVIAFLIDRIMNINVYFGMFIGALFFYFITISRKIR